MISLTCAVFRARESSGVERSDLFDQIVGYIPLCRESLQTASSAIPERATEMRQIFEVAEVESLCELQSWEEVLQIFRVRLTTSFNVHFLRPATRI